MALLKERLSLLLVFALVLVNIQCVTLCAAESSHCGESCPQHRHAPRHHDDPAPCSHQVIQAADATARVTLHPAAAVPVADLPAVSSFALLPAPVLDIFAAHAPSPPRDGIPSAILRI